MRVFVTGGSGYVGRVVLGRLRYAGHEVIALQRPNTVRPIDQEDIEIVLGDLFDRDLILQCLTGVDAIVHLVGIIREAPKLGVTMQRVHVEGTEVLIEAGISAGVKHFIHMSALGARPNATSKYHQSKWEAEQRIVRSEIAHTIFQPSVIFGKGGPGPEFVGQLADLVRRAPVIPMIGNGQYPLQPVSVDTVAEAITRAVRNPSGNRSYEVGGPTVVTYKDMICQIAGKLNKPVRSIPIPMGIMSFFTRLLESVPSFPLTMDQLTMLKEGNVCSDTESVYRDFGLSPVPFAVDI